MRKLIIALAILALLAVTVYAADNECSGATNCNTKQTLFDKPKYCDDKKCKDASAKKAGDKDLKNEHYCEESYRQSGECRLMGSKGCESKDVKCASGTDKDGKKCDFGEKPDTDEPSAGLGDRCGGSEAKERCKADEDLHCHGTFKVCVKLPAPGEPCVEGNCQVNAVCNYGTCHAVGTFGVGDYVASAALCESNREVNGKCAPAFATENYRQYCQANSECKGHGVCDMDRGDREGWGLCVGADQYAAVEMNICKGQRCVGDENNKDCEWDESKCLSANVKDHCAKECAKHPSERAAFKQQGVYEGTYAYSVDCAAQTATALEDNKCDYKPEEVVANCDAVFSSYRENSASSLSGNSVALVAAAAALIALVF